MSGSPEITEMARLLTEVLAHEQQVEPWDEMTEMDKSAMMRGCEVLLCHWDLLNRAKKEILP